MAETGNVVATTTAVNPDRHMASEAASAAVAVFNLFMMAGALISPLPLASRPPTREQASGEEVVQACA